MIGEKVRDCRSGGVVPPTSASTEHAIQTSSSLPMCRILFLSAVELVCCNSLTVPGHEADRPDIMVRMAKAEIEGNRLKNWFMMHCKDLTAVKPKYFITDVKSAKTQSESHLVQGWCSQAEGYC